MFVALQTFTPINSYFIYFLSAYRCVETKEDGDSNTLDYHWKGEIQVLVIKTNRSNLT